MAMSGTDTRHALKDMIDCLKDTFKKYNRPTRKQAWHSLQTGSGKVEIEKLLDSPTRPVVGVSRFRSFKDWMEANSN